MSVVFIYLVANEPVSILLVLGAILHIPNSILGLSVLAKANSSPDMLSIGIARNGYIKWQLEAHAGRMFDALIGLGGGFIVATSKHDLLLSETLSLMISFICSSYLCLRQELSFLCKTFSYSKPLVSYKNCAHTCTRQTTHTHATHLPSLYQSCLFLQSIFSWQSCTQFSRYCPYS